MLPVLVPALGNDAGVQTQTYGGPPPEPPGPGGPGGPCGPTHANVPIKNTSAKQAMQARRMSVMFIAVSFFESALKELRDHFHHVILLLVGQLRIDRQC